MPSGPDRTGRRAVGQAASRRSLVAAASERVLAGRHFFPELISGPFHNGLVIVFATAAGLAALAGVVSLLRGGRYIHPTSTDQ